MVELLVDMPSNQNAPSTKGALIDYIQSSVQSECSSTKGADHWWNIVSIFVVGLAHPCYACSGGTVG
jgi:hypothetical protein